MDGAAGATFLVLPLDPDGQGAGTAFDPEALRAGLASDGGPSVFDACLGVALARSLERKLGAAGAHVLSARAGTRACEALGLEVPLDEEAARLVLRYAGATRLLQGTFEREAGKLALALSLFEVGEGESPPEPARILASGEVSAFQGVLERAAREIVTQSGRTLPASFPRETESWDAYMALARAQAALLQGDVAAAEDELAAARRLDPLYVEPHEVAANAARDMGDGERAIDSLRIAVRLHREAGRGADHANALLSLGHALVEAGRWDEGTQTYEEAATICEGMGDVRGVVQARSNVANVHLRRGEHARAVEEYARGLERLVALGAKAGAPHLEDAARLAFNLGTAHKLAGELSLAAGRFEEARRLGVEARDDGLIANAYNALGTVHDEQGDLDRALHSYRQAEEHLESRADPVLLAGVKDNIGIILKKRADLEGALEYSTEACALLETHGDPHRMAIAYTNRAGLLLDLDRGDEALRFALFAHRVFVQLKSPQAKATESLLEDLGVDPSEADSLDLGESSSSSSDDATR